MIGPDTTETTLDSFSDLPMQPTGSGAVDLEIAYEQMRLAEADDGADLAAHVRETDKVAGDDGSMTPTEIRDDAADSAAHPS